MIRKAVIAVGSNLGDRRAAVAFAAERLAAILTDASLSELIETEPEGEGLEDQPLYLNAVIVGDTALAPRGSARHAAGDRERVWTRASVRRRAAHARSGLVLFGEEVVDEPGLQVPHPRFRQRFFVLGPLAQVAPDVRDPVTGLRAGELLRNLLRDGTR